MPDEHFMRVALEEAVEALQHKEFPVGAVVVINEEIIGRGRKQTHDFHLGHAETLALQNALNGKRYKRTDNLTIFSTLEPCIMCYGSILHCPIGRVVYGMEDPWGGSTRLTANTLPIRHQEKLPEIKGGVLREESRKLLKKFLEITEDPFWEKADNPLNLAIKENQDTK